LSARAAIAGARTYTVKTPLTRFVNAEPDESGFGPLPELERGMRGVVELTERTLTNRLAELLPAVQRARADGWGIALDSDDTQSSAAVASSRLVSAVAASISDGPVRPGSTPQDRRLEP
jgi:hypothetical protein